MSDIPVRPPAPPPPLPRGWTEHKAPSGHTYYYNSETKKSTYTRPLPETHAFHNSLPPQPPPQTHFASAAPAVPAAPAAPPVNSGWVPPAQPQLQDFIFGSAEQNWKHGTQLHARGGHRGGFRGSHIHSDERRREPRDRPKHRDDIPNCAPWVLVKTKLGRRFVWNKETNESFWKFPPDVMKAVVEFDRIQREKKERRERGEPSEDEDVAAMAEIEADLAAAEEEVVREIVEVDGDEGMEDDEEYEEVEVTDDEGDSSSHHRPKRQRTEEPAEDQPMEMGEDDMAWQLAQMEAMEADVGEEEEDEEEGLPLTEEDCKALFKELLDDLHISPYAPWDKLLDEGHLYEDERYKALPTMKARKECFDKWARERIRYLKEQKAQQQKLDPRIPYLAFLYRFATPKLYWPEFRRKYRKEPEMRDTKLPDKEKERLYRDHIKRLGMRQSDLKFELSTLLKAQSLASLNRSSTLETLPPSILTDLRFISLPASSRDSQVEAHIATLPPAPEGAAISAEEEAEMAKKRAERERRERALADRERRVRDEKRKQDRDLEYGKGRLREEEMEIERAMNVGKDGLKGQLGE